MASRLLSDSDQQAALDDLNERGYAVIEEVLDPTTVEHYKNLVADLFERERQEPYDPDDGTALSDDEEIRQFLRDSYHISNAELERLMRRICSSRAQNLDTPWPVPIDQVNKCFLHLPTFFDDDQSQRIWNLIAKTSDCGRLIEFPFLLKLVQGVLGDDCVLADCSATSIGAHTGGGAWHVDVPLGQLPEPLPDFSLTVQNAWVLDEFTAANGATRVVEGSHLWRKKPRWEEGQQQEEVVLEAPPGSLAVWLSNTWHRSGPNSTAAPRRAILCYYSRSWVKPFMNNVACIDPEVARGFSPQLRYLLGFSAYAPSWR